METEGCSEHGYCDGAGDCICEKWWSGSDCGTLSPPFWFILLCILVPGTSVAIFCAWKVRQVGLDWWYERLRLREEGRLAAEEAEMHLRLAEADDNVGAFFSSDVALAWAEPKAKATAKGTTRKRRGMRKDDESQLEPQPPRHGKRPSCPHPKAPAPRAQPGGGQLGRKLARRRKAALDAALEVDEGRLRGEAREDGDEQAIDLGEHEHEHEPVLASTSLSSMGMADVQEGSEEDEDVF
jgi:hypothetical protein